MGLFQEENHIAETPKHNTTNNIKMRSPSGYDVIR